MALALADLGAQAAIDVLDRRGELLLVGRQQLVHPRQRHAGVGQRPDPDQLDDGCRVVAPVPRLVALGLGQQPLGVVVAHRPHGHAGVGRELADRQHVRPLFIEVSVPGGSGELAVVRAHGERVGDDQEADAPGEGDPHVVAERLFGVQVAERVDDRGDGLVLGEPLAPGRACRSVGTNAELTNGRNSSG